MKVKMGDVVAAGPAPRQSCIISLGCLFLASALVTACASASAEGQQQPAGLSIAGPQVAAQEADVPQRNADFALWLDELRREAEAEGISPSTFRAAFAGVTPIARVIELDRRQPEFTQTFWRYFQNAISEERVQRGRRLLKEHEALLQQMETRYGVQPHYLVAFWGLETNYGDTFGNFPVIGALATLAHDQRRSDFFRNELLSALRILEAGDIEPARMEGSWAGAMGHLQFMPSTYRAYAVDADGDGRRDIWGSFPDVFASAGNFLSQLGWRAGEDWGREVLLPADFDHSLASIATKPEAWKPLQEWEELGLRPAQGHSLPDGEGQAALILPAGHDGPAFLVFDNYERILGWNRSIFYAVAVGHLADRIAGGPPLAARAPEDDQRLTKSQVREVQSLLEAMGYNAGGVDGQLGPKTRLAIRDFQRSRGLPQDAFAEPGLLGELRSAAKQ